MCILVVKKKGVDYPSLEQVKNCCKANPHGFSLSYSYKGRMRTYRTMSERDFLMEFQKIAERYPCEDVAMILHARIATHGTISPHNCHCFQGEGLSFAHNGILPIENRGDLTDSEITDGSAILDYRKGTHAYSITFTPAKDYAAFEIMLKMKDVHQKKMKLELMYTLESL